MKTYKVKVNGKLFEVQLEAVSESKETIKADAPVAAAPAAAPAPAAGGNNIVAPIGGKLLRYTVNVGDTVKVGQIVAVIEAMKLENEVPSTVAGKVTSIVVKAGDMVQTKDVIITIA